MFTMLSPAPIAIMLTWPHDPVEWLAAIAAIIAAVFGFVTVRDARTAQRIAEANRQRDLEPRLHWEADQNQGGYLDVRISNAGGAVQRGYYRVQVGALVYEIGNFQVPAQSPFVGFRATWVDSGSLINGSCNVLLVCQGSDGRWWDWTRGMPEPLDNPPGVYPTTAEFRAWLKPRLERRGREVMAEVDARAAAKPARS